MQLLPQGYTLTAKKQKNYRILTKFTLKPFPN